MALILTGCAASQTSGTAPAAETPAADPTGAGAYLDAMHQPSYSAYDGAFTDEQLLKWGQGVCADFNDGMTGDQVYAAQASAAELLNPGDSELVYYLQVNIPVATHYLCHNWDGAVGLSN